jgi:hypothetical protein
MWRDIYLLYASSPTDPMSYTTHNDDITTFLEASGVDGKLAKTHLYRTEVKARQSHAAVGELDSDRHMGFRHMTSTDVYGRASHCLSAAIPTARWPDKDHFECSWESDGTAIPAEVSISCYYLSSGLPDYVLTTACMYNCLQLYVCLYPLCAYNYLAYKLFPVACCCS